MATTKPLSIIDKILANQPLAEALVRFGWEVYNRERSRPDKTTDDIFEGTSVRLNKTQKRLLEDLARLKSQN